MIFKNHGLNFLLFILVLIFLSSCKNSRLNKLDGKSGGYIAKIAVSAGDHIDHINNDTLNFLAFPYNVGVFENARKQTREVIIIGESLRHGLNVSFKPIAKLTYKTRLGETRILIIARPTELKYVTAQVDDFFELISVHYGIQKMIETWITYANGLGSSTELTWENEDKAINYLTN